MPTQVDNALIRGQLIKTYDEGEQQKLEAFGRHRERFGGTTGKNATPRIQDYGKTSHAPAGSQGHVVTPDGNPDKAMIHGMEHPKHRPTDLQEGEIKWYDMWGHFCYAQENQWYWKIGESEMWMKADGTIHLKGKKIILEVEDKVYIGGPAAELEVAMKGSIDNDDEISGSDALVGKLAKKANVI